MPTVSAGQIVAPGTQLGTIFGVPVPATVFQWFQPNESELNERFGNDASSVTATVQLMPPGFLCQIRHLGNLTTFTVQAIPRGQQTVTPLSMEGIVVGSILTIDVGIKTEQVNVIAVTATTFTAVFATAHDAASRGGNADAATRRNAARNMLEYPALRTNGVQRWISRNTPMAYPPPFVSGEADDPYQLYATRFSNGKGVGPRGQDDGAPSAANPGVPTQLPIPVYRCYQYELEFADRTYDILPDSAVAAPGPIDSPFVDAVTLNVTPRGNGIPPGNYTLYVTALNGEGETTPGFSGLAQVVVADFFKSITVTWNAIPGASKYRVYLKDPNRGNTVYLVDEVIFGTTLTFLQLPINVQPLPTDNTTASPLWIPGPAIAYPDEGAALAAGNGQVGSRYVTRNGRIGGRSITIPRGFMFFQDTGVVIPEGLMKVVPTVNLVYTWHAVPRAAIPVRAIQDAQGCVNCAYFDSWPPGTLLLDPMDPKRYRSPLGGRLIDIQFTMTGLLNTDLNNVPQGHNAALQYTGGYTGIGIAVTNAGGDSTAATAATVAATKGGATGDSVAAAVTAAAAGQPWGAAAAAAKAAFGVGGKLDYSRVASDVPGRGGNPPYRSRNFAALFRPSQG